MDDQAWAERQASLAGKEEGLEDPDLDPDLEDDLDCGPPPA